MAEIKEKATAKTQTVFLDRLGGENAVQTMLVSINGKDYYVPRGKSVEVPEEVYNVIEDARKAEYAHQDRLEDLAKRATLSDALK